MRRWVDRRPRHSRYKNGRRGGVNVLSRAVRWLRFSGRLRLPVETPPAYCSLLEPFDDYLRVEKGLSEGTIETRHWYVEDFLKWFFRDHNSLRQICREQMLVHTRTRGISRIATGVSARKPTRGSILERCAAPCRHH